MLLVFFRFDHIVYTTAMLFILFPKRKKSYSRRHLLYLLYSHETSCHLFSHEHYLLSFFQEISLEFEHVNFIRPRVLSSHLQYLTYKEGLNKHAVSQSCTVAKSETLWQVTGRSNLAYKRLASAKPGCFIAQHALADPEGGGLRGLQPPMGCSEESKNRQKPCQVRASGNPLSKKSWIRPRLTLYTVGLHKLSAVHEDRGGNII